MHACEYDKKLVIKVIFAIIAHDLKTMKVQKKWWPMSKVSCLNKEKDKLQRGQTLTTENKECKGQHQDNYHDPA